jgi:hypothetical protein
MEGRGEEEGRKSEEKSSFIKIARLVINKIVSIRRTLWVGD